MFTAAGGHGTEFTEFLPANVRATIEPQIVRTPKTPDEARAAVRELKAAGVDGLKAILEAGFPGRLFERLDSGVLRAVGDEARAQRLPLVVHTGNSQDVADALDAGASGIEHGPRDPVSDRLLKRMKDSSATYDPTLSVWEAQADFAAGKTDLLERSLVLQTVGQNVLGPTRARLQQRAAGDTRLASAMGQLLKLEGENLKRAYDAGVTLVAGSDAGNPLVFHGPTIHHELALWVAAGIPPAAALQAATWTGARLLRAESRIGLVASGHDADLLVIDGNPLTDITALERISIVVFKGERIRRAALFSEGQGARVN
jgi:imidazolonepropionase-like amidohydrolase